MELITGVMKFQSETGVESFNLTKVLILSQEPLPELKNKIKRKFHTLKFGELTFSALSVIEIIFLYYFSHIV